MAQEDPNALLQAEIGQKIFLVKDGKVLMCKNAKEDFFENLWDFPGGRMHKGEQPKEALARELKEELGVEFIIGTPLFTSITYQTPSNIPRYYVIFEATLTNLNAEFTVAEDEIAELKWVGAEDVATLPTWDDWREFLNIYFQKLS